MKTIRKIAVSQIEGSLTGPWAVEHPYIKYSNLMDAYGLLTIVL